MSEYYWSEDNANGTEMGRYLTRIETRFLGDTFRQLGWPRRVLDVGGGDGRFARWLECHSCPTVVLERDSLPLAELRQRGWHHPMVLGDGNRLPFQARSFDAILAMEVAHVTDSDHLDVFLRQAHDLLAQRGLLVFTTENPLSWVGVLKLLSPGRYDYGDYRYYTLSFGDVCRHLRARSFRLVSALGFRWPPLSRVSNSRLVPAMAHLEELLALRRLPMFSPWIFWAAQRQ